MRRHDTDLTALVSGLVFVLLGAGFWLDEVDAWHLQARWVWPVLLIGLGVAGLAGSGARYRRQQQGSAVAGEEPPVVEVGDAERRAGG